MRNDADQYPTGYSPRSFWRVAALVGILIGSVNLPCATLPLAAQTSDAPKSSAQMTRAERAAAKEARRQKLIEQNAALRKKRDACLQERKDKKIPVFERPAFIRACMARP
jgi:hypothetical protein